jgi:hypothetical protein
VVIDNLDEARLRALRLNLNRLAEDSSWDDNALRQEFDEIQFIDSTLDLSLTGFETAEIDLLLSEPDGDEDDMIPDPEAEENPVTVSGDLWGLGEHCILCGDAKDPQSYAALFGGTEGRARTVITDPPYNVEIDGHVCGSGQIKHSEFVEAAGEKSQEEFRGFLSTGMRNAADYSIDGSLHYWCMDWRHIHDLYAAAEEVYGPPRNLAVWVKTNAGMGSLYRSQHELVGVFKLGKPVMRSRKSDEVFNDYLDSLATLERQALVAEWTRCYGKPPFRQMSRDLLVRSLAHRLQEQRWGGLKPALARRLRQVAGGGKDARSITPAAPRPKAGTRLIRQWHGTTHEVLVTDAGFEWKGRKLGRACRASPARSPARNGQAPYSSV